MDNFDALELEGLVIENGGEVLVHAEEFFVGVYLVGVICFATTEYALRNR